MEWDSFLINSNSATFYHSQAWKEVLEKTFEISPFYLCIKRENNSVVGVCPGFITTSIYQKCFHSLPFSDYGGPIILKNDFIQGSRALRNFLYTAQKSKGINIAKFRVLEDESKYLLSDGNFGTCEKHLGVMELSLKNTPSDYVWKNVFSASTRKKINQIERRSFQVRQASSKSDLEAFYKLYHKNMLYIGAIPFPMSLFENIWSILYPQHVRIWLIEKDSIVAASVVFKDWKKSYNTYVAINRSEKYATLDFNPLMRWKEIKLAEEEGLETVSLGSTPSDPKNKYHFQKAGFGSKFRQQDIVSLPLNSFGDIFLKSRHKVFSTWLKSNRYLPHSLSRMLRKESSRF